MDSGVVHEAHDRAELCRRFVDDMLGLGPLPDVTLHCDGPTAQFLDRRHDLRRRVAVADVVDGHRMARVREANGDGGTDPTGPAGHQRGAGQAGFHGRHRPQSSRAAIASR